MAQGRSVNQIRAEIRLTTGNSLANIENLNRSLQKFHNGFSNGSAKISGFTKGTDALSVKLVGLKSNIDALNNSFSVLSRVGNAFRFAFGGAVQYSTMMENNAIGISGILKSMVTLNGKTLEWNQAMGMSANLMAKLRVEALQTSATSQDLIETFRALLGPGLGAGMTIDEILKFTSVGVNAVKSMGLPTNQYIQELRGLEQGGIRASSSTLATALGLTDSDIKAAKNSSEGLFRFLMQRMEGFARSTTENSKTLTGRIAIMQEGLFSAMKESGEDIYRDFSDWIKSISDKMFVLNRQTNLLELNPEFVRGMGEIADHLQTVSKVGQTVLSGVAGNINGISKSLMALVSVKVGSAILNSGIGALRNIGNAASQYNNFFSQNSVGKAINNINALIEETELLNKSNLDLRNTLNNIDNSVFNLTEHYMKLGASAGKAADMQQRVINAIYAGKSYSDIEAIKRGNELAIANENDAKRIADIHTKSNQHMQKMISLYEKEKQKINEINLAEQKSIELHNKKLAKQTESIAKAEQEARLRIGNEMDFALSTGGRDLASQINATNKKAELFQGGMRTENSLTRLEEQLIKLGMDRADAAERMAELNYLIRENPELVNATSKSWLTAAQHMGVEKLKKAEVNSVEKNIQAVLEQKEAELARRNTQNRVDMLTSGKGSYTRKDVEGRIAFTEEQVDSARRMKAALAEAGVEQDRVNKLVDRYRTLIVQGNEAAIERYKESVMQVAVETKANVERIEATKVYGEAIEKVKLQTDSLKTANDKLKMNMRVLWIDAKNNLELYAKEDVQAAGIISSAMEKMSNATTAGFTKEENRLKAIAALQKEVAAGNMEMALAMSKGYNAALANNAGRNVDAEVQRSVIALTEQRNELERKHIEELNKYQKEREAIHNKTVEQIKRETAAIVDLNTARSLEKQTVQEVTRLSAEQINQQQREILFYEAKVKVVQSSGTKQIASIDKVIAGVRKAADEVKLSTDKQKRSYEALMGTLKALALGTLKYNDNVNKQIEVLLKNLANSESRFKSLATKVGAFAGSLGSLGFAYQMLTNDAETNIGKLAEWVIQGSIVVSAAEGMIPALASVRDLYDAIAKSALGAKVATYGLSSALLLVAGASAIYSGYKDKEAYEKYGMDMFKRDKDGNLIYDENGEIEKFTAEELEQKRQKSLENFRRLEDKFSKQLKAKNPAETDGEINLRYPKEEKEDEKAKKHQLRVEQAEASYKSLAAAVNIANGELTKTYTEYDKMLDSANKKVIDWTKSLDSAYAKADGAISEAQYNTLIEAMQHYIELTKEEVALRKQEAEVANTLQEIENRASDGLSSQFSHINARRSALEDERKLLEKQLELYRENSDERVKIETKLSANLKAIRSNDMYDMRTAWKSALQEISLEQINFGEGVKSVFSSVQSAGVTLLTSTGSFMERVANFFNSITQSILENMAKMIMQGLITNAILSAFGGGGKIGFNLNTPNMNYAAPAIPSGVGINIGGRFANGGVAKGWSIVGEEGPELVNFSAPGRVYTAKQTANALGNAGNVNIKIDLKNESGIEMKAETTGSTFDGESYIVGVVLKAISNNKNGMRNIIKGVAMA